MPYAPLVKYSTIDEYRTHFRNKYCCGNLTTFDGISVRFSISDFNHAFFESRLSKDDEFSTLRAERIDWIEKALQDPDAILKQGWDKTRKRNDPSRRVAVVGGNYVVIIQTYKDNRAKFISAYVADSPRTILLIDSSPDWK